MKKFYLIGIMLFLLLTNIYSQDVSTSQFLFIADNISREKFIEVATSFQEEDGRKGYIQNNRLPNSLINEINRQLNDYSPLNVGQVFIGVLIYRPNNIAGSQGYRIYIRITDAVKSEWEYFASMTISNVSDEIKDRLEPARRIVLQTLDEADALYREFLRTAQSYPYIDPAELGKIAGRYTWCKNASIMLSDNLTNRADINFWLRRAEECEKLREEIGKIAVMAAVNSRNERRFMDIYHENTRGIGNILMNRLFTESGLTPR